MKTEARAFKSTTDSIQARITDIKNDLEFRRQRGDHNLTDSFENGFITAMKLINDAYGLDIEF